MRALTSLPALLLAVSIIAAGLHLQPSSAAAATMQQGVIAVHGQQQRYLIALPERFARAGRRPIMLMLHGGDSDGARIAELTNLGAHVDRGGFIAVFPDSGGRQWNDGRETTRAFPDDVAYLVGLVREIVARYDGDAARVFVAGASAGGMMVQRLACEATNVFAAYAVVVANMPAALAGECRPSRPARMILINSPSDPLMPWAGGYIRVGPFRGLGGRVLSTPETLDFWSRSDRCRGPLTDDLPDLAQDGTHVRRHDFGACGLILYEIDGGGHTWPGSNIAMGFLARRLLGATTHNIDATAVILDFCRRYGL